MVDRKLTESEIEALEDLLGEEFDVEITDGNEYSVNVTSTSTHNEYVKRPFYKNWFFWAIFPLMAGVLSIAFVTITVVSANQMLGSGTLDLLTQQNLTDETVQFAQTFGINGLDKAVFFYKYRWVVLSAIVCITLILTLICVYLGNQQRRSDKERLIDKARAELEKEQLDSVNAM